MNLDQLLGIRHTGHPGLATVLNPRKDRRLRGKQRRIARKRANALSRTETPYDPTRDTAHLLTMGVTELRNLARGLHLKRYSKLNKPELVERIVTR